MDQQRNLIIAIALSIAILLGFEYFFGQRQPVHPPAPATQTTAPSTPGTPSTAMPNAPGAAAAPEAKPRDQVLAGAPRVAIDTPSLKGSISLTGARLDDLILKKYLETIDKQSPPIVLLSPDGSEHPYFIEYGWVTAPNSTVKAPDGTTRWTASPGALTPQHPIDLTWDNGSGVRFIRHYAVDDNYMFTVTQTVENKSGQPVTLYPYALASHTGNPTTSSTYILHEGPIGVLDGTLKEVKYSELKAGKTDEFKSTGGWLGITDKYWLTALIPDQQEVVKARFTSVERGKTEVYQVDYTGAEQVVPAGGSVSLTDHLFAGAKEVHLLDSYESAYGVPLFDHAIDFGWFYWITKPIFLTLDFFYQRIGNFGLAILLLTVIIKLIFFPLQSKSYRAMSKMKLLQPEMEKLKAKYGEDQ